MPAKREPGPERILVVLLGAAAGYMLASVILVQVDPLMQPEFVRFFSVLAGIALAAIAAKVA
jgi:hypothetical protein